MYLCLCKGLTKADVERAWRSGAGSTEELSHELGLDDPACCGRCAKVIGLLLESWEARRVARPPFP